MKKAMDFIVPVLITVGSVVAAMYIKEAIDKKILKRA
jgi:hypothetical protein